MRSSDLDGITFQRLRFFRIGENAHCLLRRKNLEWEWRAQTLMGCSAVLMPDQHSAEAMRQQLL